MNMDLKNTTFTNALKDVWNSVCVNIICFKWKKGTYNSFGAKYY